MYTGDWRGDLFEGAGTIVCATGYRYSGQWRRGKPHGEGEYMLGPVERRGDVYRPIRYSGKWEDGVFHGKGQLEAGDGTQHEGNFANGRIVGPGTYVFPSGKRRDCVFDMFGRRESWLD